MKIAYDHQIFATQRHGGISRYFAEVVQGLLQCEGVEPTVIAPLHINRYLLSAGVRSSVRGTFLARDFPNSSRVIRWFNSAVLPTYWNGASFDIVHETYYSSRCRGRARIRVVTLHDMINELFPDEFPGAEKVARWKRAAVSRADHVICISETTRQDAIRMLDIDPRRCSVIHLGSSPSGTGADQTFVNRPGRPFLLYVGNRTGYKNFAILLRCFDSSAKLRRDYDLVAFGGGKFSSEERAAIRAAGLADQVRHVDGDDLKLRRYYRWASAFIFPSRYEGFGIPPLEAMANSCPVICSNAGSIAEVVGDAGGYFQPDDSDALRVQLERVVADQQYAADLRAKGLRRVAGFSWSKCARETLKTYRRLLTSAAS